LVNIFLTYHHEQEIVQIFTHMKLANLILLTSVELIGDFWNPNPVQNILSVTRSDPNPVDLSKYLIQSGLHPKKL